MVRYRRVRRSWDVNVAMLPRMNPLVNLLGVWGNRTASIGVSQPVPDARAPVTRPAIMGAVMSRNSGQQRVRTELKTTKAQKRTPGIPAAIIAYRPRISGAPPPVAAEAFRTTATRDATMARAAV